MKLSEKHSVVENIIFKQERVGINGDIFKVYKFRTMIHRAEDNTPKYIINGEDKIHNDSRIIISRKWLRKYGIDEIPQIINIIKGEMHIFGPRPTTLNRFDQYSQHQKDIRKDVKPGIFGHYSLYYKGKKTRSLIELEDIYLHLRKKKENKGSQSIIMFNSWVFINAIKSILKGANK